MFYARFHKRHHLLINRMTPYSAFLDTTLEFVAMEVVGGFLLPLFLVPAPAWAITLVWTLHVGSGTKKKEKRKKKKQKKMKTYLFFHFFFLLQGLLDHSNTYVKDSMLFDSIYHSDHHKLSVWNFAELEVRKEKIKQDDKK